MAKIKQIDGLQTALDAKLAKNTAITGATKAKITYDANGLVTAGADLAATDIPTLDIVAKTSGTLTVQRGGTGKTSVTANSYLKGAGTGALVERTYAEVKTDLGLQNASNYAAIMKAASSTDGKLPKWVGTAGDQLVDGYAVVATIGANPTDTNLPTEKAVADKITNSLAAANAMTYKGAIDCSTNPNYPAADAGDTYKVSGKGKIGGVDGVSVDVGYLLVCKADSTAAGTQLAVGENWDIVPINNAGEVIGPASVATDGNIAVFNGMSGKLIKDGGKTIAQIEAAVAGASTQEKRALTGKEATASTVLTMTAVLGHSVKADTIPQLTINGLAYELGTYGALTDGQWAHSGTDVQVKMPFAIETSDVFYIIYNY